MKSIKLFICVAGILLCCCGCWDKQELEDNTFVVLLGIDKAEGKDVLVTIAFPLTQLEGGKQGEGGSSGEYSVMSVKAHTLIEGLNMLGTKLVGPVSLFTLKTVVISEELAETDMLRHAFSAWRYEQTRNTTSVLISKCKAAEFISARVKEPAIDVLRQEELLLEQVNRSSYYKPVQLLELITNLKSDGVGSVVMYGGVASKEEGKDGEKQEDTKSGDEKADKGEEQKHQEENKGTDMNAAVRTGYLPGEIPIEADNESQICGLVVFRGDKMAGTLNSAETQTYSMLTKSKARKVLTLPDPLEPDYDIVISVMPAGNSKINSYINGDIPAFDIGVNLHCTLECVQSNVDYNESGNLSILTEYIREVCANDINGLITKIQKEYNADILRLGDKLAYHFLTADEWNAFNWREKYMDAQIDINVGLKIDRTGILMP